MERLKIILPETISFDDRMVIKHLSDRAGLEVLIEPEVSAIGIEITTLTGIGILITGLINTCYNIYSTEQKKQKEKNWSKEKIVSLVSNKLLEFDEIGDFEISIENYTALLNNSYHPCIIHVQLDGKKYKFSLYKNGGIFKIDCN